MEKKEIFFLTVICLEWKKTRPFLGNDTMLHVVYRCQYFILLIIIFRRPLCEELPIKHCYKDYSVH